MDKKIFSFFLVLVFYVITLLAQDNFAEEYNTEIKINNQKLKVEISESESELSWGLMYRKSMPDSCGMLFIFPYEDILSFWMKDTYIPLSIAFIDKAGTIVSIKEGVPFSLNNISSDYPAIYALEVNKGWFKKNKIKTGDTVDF